MWGNDSGQQGCGAEAEPVEGACRVETGVRFGRQTGRLFEKCE